MEVVPQCIIKGLSWANAVLEGEESEEGLPQQFVVRATFSSFSCPSHLEILVLPTDRDAYLENIVYRVNSFFHKGIDSLPQIQFL